MAHNEGDQATGRDGNDSVVISIEKDLLDLPRLSSECCIYKVPERLRKTKVEDYTPLVISIGPFHRGNLALQAMEEHKLRYLESFVARRRDLRMDDYVTFLRTKEEKARSYYAENIKLSSDKFVEMILVDGCFLVELILKWGEYGPFGTKGKCCGGDDRIFNKPWMRHEIRRDLMLLENQLPFFVLEDLFYLNKGCARDNGDNVFLKLWHGFFENYMKVEELPDSMSGLSSGEVMHITHFLRLYYLPSDKKKYDSNKFTTEGPPTAVELDEAGVRFKKRTSSCLFDIEFNKGILEISHLNINDIKETLFRNLIAFEQCHYLGEKQQYITEFIIFMDKLINIPKDVDLLIRHKIITNNLGSSEEVSTMFNSITKDVIIGRSGCFYSMWKDLNDYRHKPQHRWKATLKRDYFNTPWKIASTIAAVVLLILTFIQAVCSIIAL